MKVVLIGHGMVSDTHVAAINDSALVDLHGVLGRDADRARRFADRQSRGIKVFKDIQEVADDPEIGFAIVTTPPNARLDIVEVLGTSSIPILMEKPVERTLVAANSLVGMCEDHCVPLGIVFQHRARVASQALKKGIENGQLGQLVSVEIRVPWWRDQSYYDEPGRGTFERDGGGVMINQAIHTLDLALWLLGPVQSLQAVMHKTPMHQLEAEDWAAALLRFSSGAVGTLMATTSAFPGGTESISIQGTKASAHLEAGVLRIRYFDGREEAEGAESGTGGGSDPMAFTHEWHQTIIEDFAYSLKEDRPPMCTGRDALHSHRVIDAMVNGGHSGETVFLK